MLDMRTLFSQSKLLRSALLFFGVVGIGAAASRAENLMVGKSETPTLSGASCEAVEEAKTEEVYFTSCGGFI